MAETYESIGTTAQAEGFRPVLPGGTVGLIGGGQLGRMFAIAARRMGYRVHTLEPVPDSSAGQISDREISAAYDDLEKLGEFARGVDVSVHAATKYIGGHSDVLLGLILTNEATTPAVHRLWTDMGVTLHRSSANGGAVLFSASVYPRAKLKAATAAKVALA